MGDKAGINRSLNNVRTELEYLRDSGVLVPAQFQSIMAQLPVSSAPKIYQIPHIPYRKQKQAK